MFYTYLWLCEAGTPYYAGKGQGNRAYEYHRRVGKAPSKDRVIVQYHPSEEDALAAEVCLIDFYGRKDLSTGPLLNHSEGGIGGRTLSPEQCQQRSVLYRERGVTPPSRRGQTHKLSDHTKRAISAARKGKSNGRLGYRHSEVTKERIRQAFLRRRQAEEAEFLNS